MQTTIVIGTITLTDNAMGFHPSADFAQSPVDAQREVLKTLSEMFGHFLAQAEAAASADAIAPEATPAAPAPATEAA